MKETLNTPPPTQDPYDKVTLDDMYVYRKTGQLPGAERQNDGPELQSLRQHDVLKGLGETALQAPAPTPNYTATTEMPGDSPYSPTSTVG